MIVRLPYGTGSLTADLRGLRCRTLDPGCPHHAAGVAELVAAALDRPAGTASLDELARGRRRITIVVPDATRKAALPDVLPAVIGRLLRGGVAAGNLTVLVACGTHPPASTAALARLLGPVPTGVSVVQHDAHDESGLVPAGRTPAGTLVRLNRLAVECDLLVTISSIQHHYFAGFGGGPKMVFPGVAGYVETQANHARVIDVTLDPPRRHPACEPGRIEGNPVAEEIAAAAALRVPDYALAVVNDGAGVPCWADSGAPEPVFAHGRARVREWFEVDAASHRRIVVSAGGYPTDHTLIQAHKALDAACRFAADGAEVLFVARCDGGGGSPAMTPFLDDPRPSAIIAALAADYVQYGHTTLRLVEKTARYRVRVVTDLDRGLVSRLGMEPVPSPQAVLDEWRRTDASDTVAVMAGAPVYPRVS